MSTFSGMIIASVNDFTNGTPDKHGKAPVILNVVAGKCPNRHVLSGTVAENMKIEVGNTYLFNVREGAEDAEYGRQFVFNKLKELSVHEIVSAASTLGEAQMFDVAEGVKSPAKVNSEFDQATV